MRSAFALWSGFIIVTVFMKLILTIFLIAFGSFVRADDSPLDVWPDLAPGETTRSTGEKKPSPAKQDPPITLMTKVTQPTFTVHAAEDPNGAGVVILPGGGFSRVVPDLEGSEAAAFLNRIGVTVFVLSYRTKNSPDESGWEKPLQDAQRTLAIVRSRAAEWKLDKDKIGLLGFSAGGNVAARLLSAEGVLAYESVDDIDSTPHRPDFSILIYPWSIYDAEKDSLIDGVSVPESCPPTFIVHTDDDKSSSLGSVLFYAGLKKFGIPAELHVYGNGGHGYGVRPRESSEISSWPGHAAHWLSRWVEQQSQK